MQDRKVFMFGGSHKWFYLLLALLSIVICLNLYLIGRNIISENLWFDESGQIWMAKGLNHYSAPLSPEGGLLDALRQNRAFNLDPGGFTLLLFFWLKISSALIWTRVLPFLFYLGTLLFLYLFVKEISDNNLLALSATTTLFLYKMITDYAFEIRAYSMEVCGMMMTVFLLAKLLRTNSDKYLYYLGAVSALFLTSRYSYIIGVAALAVVIFVIHFGGSFRQFARKGRGFYLPVLMAGLLIYFFMLRYQMGSLAPPFYVSQILLAKQNLGVIINIIKTNTLTRSALPLVLLLCGYIIERCFFKRVERGSKVIDGICLYIASFVAINIVLSALGKYPWYIWDRYGLNLQLLSVLSLVLIIVYLFDRLNNLQVWATYAKMALFGCLLAVSLAAAGNYHKEWLNLTGSNMRALDLGKNVRILAHEKGSATIRYLCEYGGLSYFKAQGIYPGKIEFRAVEAADHRDKKYDYLIFSDVDRAQVDIYLGFFPHYKEITRYQGRSSFIYE